MEKTKNNQTNNTSAPFLSTEGGKSESNAIEIPSVSLPKGGGAIKGIGEKFAANPVTGTGSMSIPIAVSPGRGGFSPQLSLNYNSGSGNGPFGFGWGLSVPSITRKTDKGLPRYEDAVDSDEFILSGAEDLVRTMICQDEKWKKEEIAEREYNSVRYSIKKYIPRTEGLFARIEQWTNKETGIIHWRSISKDNITTLYGKTENSRIVNPDNPNQIFQWLISESYNEKGNAILYQYAVENSANIAPSSVCEKNRTPGSRSANRYLKRILYGNKTSRLQQSDLSEMEWMFEVIFDYDEGHYQELPINGDNQQLVSAGIEVTHDWPVRKDPFSTYRAGFELRTYRLCKRALMFHHFNEELGQPDYLVKSTEFNYEQTSVASFITSVIQSGYVLNENGNYLKKSLPPVEFSYSKAVISEEVKAVDGQGLENLPIGLDGNAYQWVDLFGEGLNGILSEQANAWFYKPNIGEGKFGSQQKIISKPAGPGISNGSKKIMDLAGDGKTDLVQLEKPLSGFYELDENDHWNPFTAFKSVPSINWGDPDLKFVDLTGDGHADILISEEHVFTWYQSLAEDGYAPGEKVQNLLNEEHSPALVFADGTQSVYLADFSGFGLTDIVRIRNGEICYWPNMGYGRFGAKVTMDNSPLFDYNDQFDHKRIRLADIDGSGSIDIIYLGRDHIALYFNQSGNSWSSAHKLSPFPYNDDLESVMVTDLLGNGTACLVWSSPLPGAAGRQMQYIDLMGGQKPHLLIVEKNNMGAETRVQYVSSTKFYLEDKANGDPWITRLPFPVHVVERVETYDRISKNRFVSRYAYHHGYFDGHEREFRGFGMAEQWDTEEIGTVASGSITSESTNLDEASYIPPVLTKTWFHTGAYKQGMKISRQFEKEYYQGSESSPLEIQAGLLPDTVLPKHITLPDNTTLASRLSTDEIREACRALRGSVLRKEVFACDNADKSNIPYAVTENSFTIKWLQPKAGNKHAVFFTHPAEVISFQYERNPKDPRIGHQMPLEVDYYGNVLKSATIGYGRKKPDLSDPILDYYDHEKQTQILVSISENRFTNRIDENDVHRAPLPYEAITWELTGLPLNEGTIRFAPAEMLGAFSSASEIAYEEQADGETLQKRPIEHVRTVFRSNNLNQSLPLEELEYMALPYENYQLAFTPGMLTHTFVDPGKITREILHEKLKEGGYLLSNDLKEQHIFPSTDDDGYWWIPSGRIFYSTIMGDAPELELNHAQQHFYMPCRYQDPFGHTTTINMDRYDLLMNETTDPLQNKVSVPKNNYRVLQPEEVTDINKNRAKVSFDTLGMVTGTAVMGKITETVGDSLEGFEPDLTDGMLMGHTRQPFLNPREILQGATTRLIYDLYRYMRTADTDNPLPNMVYTLARETHESELTEGEETKFQHSFLYSDGFGREIQAKVQAEPGEAPLRAETFPDSDIPGDLLLDEEGNILRGFTDIRWTGTGRTIYNNKGKAVKKYEPFFSTTHLYEPEDEVTMTGVTPVLFYDPLGRVVATLHPNHTWEKVVFDPWKTESWDVNDTVISKNPEDGIFLTDNPADDEDVGYYFARLDESGYLPGWYSQRISGTMGEAEQQAAEKAARHAGTPSLQYFDNLGRPFLSVADNGTNETGEADMHKTPLTIDIEGNQVEVTDARENTVMKYKYNMLGSVTYQNSMDAGQRWMLVNIAGNPLIANDERDHEFTFTYDELQRPKTKRVYGGDIEGVTLDNVYEKIIYGDYLGMTDEERQANENINVIGKAQIVYDTAGKTELGQFDFKGNLLRSNRRVCTDYKDTVNWNVGDPDSHLETETFTSETQYNALNRVTQAVLPDGSTTLPIYNEANLLDKVDVVQEGEQKAYVKNIDYNEKGQRIAITYGNDVTTEYEYDRKTFRLVHLCTKRRNESVLQDLFYTYDPVGNITHIRDGSIPAIFYNNEEVNAISEYTYDAVYRLIAATGREHAAQVDFGLKDNWNDAAFNLSFGGTSPTDPLALRNYTQYYNYDSVGNILQIQHIAGTGSWTREYTYADFNNRLLKTKVGSDTSNTFRYPHHEQHGFITGMPHLTKMQWNFKEELQATSTQSRSSGTPETTYYVYDGSGQRIRKITENEADEGHVPTKKNERIYLGSFEVYREYMAGETNLERQTLHVSDDSGRIALIETRTLGDDGTEEKLVRYQFNNHLGSACLEVDDSEAVQVISYEEYHPYGTTAYQAVNSQIRSAAKRYRYTGMERDDETGLEYHSARYYLPWLGRWLNTDPIGINDDVNVFLYSFGNPIKFVDSSGTENVIVVGAQYDESRANKLNFVHQGIRQLREYRRNESQESRSFVIFTEGYTENQLTRIREVVEGLGATFIAVDSVNELIQYINTGSSQDNREQDRISNLDIYSHGVVGSIEFGYHMQDDVAARYRFDSSEVGRLDPNAFGDDGDNNPNRISSYACRTALGDNSSVVDFFGPNIGESLAQDIANQTNMTVNAYIRRSDYSATLGTTIDRNSQCAHIIFGERCYTSALRSSIARREDIDGADFDPNGALHPVRVGDTPIFLFSLSSWEVEVEPQEEEPPVQDRTEPENPRESRSGPRCSFRSSPVLGDFMNSYDYLYQRGRYTPASCR